MKIVLVSKCSLDIEQYVEFEMSVLMSLSKSFIRLCWVTYNLTNSNCLVLREGMRSYLYTYQNFTQKDF